MTRYLITASFAPVIQNAPKSSAAMFRVLRQHIKAERFDAAGEIAKNEALANAHANERIIGFSVEEAL